MITLRHKHDDSLSITLAPPTKAGDFEEAFAEWLDTRAAGLEYTAHLGLIRACAIEPKGEDLTKLLDAWSGLPFAAWQHCFTMAGIGNDADAEALDPRALLDGSDASEAHLAALAAAGVTRATIESLIREYPRKGPPGLAQALVIKFSWGYVVARAPEVTEWFATESDRKAGHWYAVCRTFVKSCVLHPPIPDLLDRNRSKPAIVSTLGSMLRAASGEDLAKRVGESSGA